MAPRLAPLLTFSPLPLLVAALLLTACGAAEHVGSAAATQEVTLSDRTFTLELADNADARQQGLSDRAEIAEDGGMLFVFPDDDVDVKHFVMRRCLVPIDIIFLGPNGRIVAMHEMQVEPYDRPEDELRRYSSQWPAQFAIELKGGTLDELGLAEGEKVDLPLDDLKDRAR